ncbi:MAG TPA: glycosyltransferase [Phycisphaerae bacterium]|nr:glycosyltransferase family 1 protein [Phycisphaerales bacterium]HRX86824.1 glycosyltransferase [Phycisphaerae bacterium]
MNVPEMTNQLAALYRAGKAFRFVQRASAALDHVPHAPDLTALVLRALVDLGYGGPARDLIAHHSEMCRDADQLHALEDALAELPDGEIPWDELDDNFRQNAALIAEHMPHLAHFLRDVPELLLGVKLYRSRYGAYHLARNDAAGSQHWIAALSTMEEDGDVTLPPRGQIPITAIVGARTGAIFTALWERTERLFLTYSHPVYVIEPSPARLAAWLHVDNHARLLDDPRLMLFAGADAAQQFEDRLRRDPRLPVPQMFVDLAESPDVAGAVRAACERVTAQRMQSLAALNRTLAERNRPRTLADWAERLAPPGPILAVTSRYTTVLQYTTRDALAALRKLGYETHLLIEKADHEQMTAELINAAIARIDPAMVLVLDHLRYEYSQLPKDVPFLCWIQDPLPNLMCARAGASVGPRDLVCGILKPRCTAEFGYPEQRFVSLENPVSLEMFHDGPIDAAAQDAHACDVCFVSNGSATLDELHAEALQSYLPALHPLLELLRRRVAETLARNEFPYDAAAEMTRDAALECGLDLNAEQLHQLASFHTYRMLDWGRRQETLQWVADWAQRTGRTLRIYGRGWENHPTLSRWSAGVLEHGEPLRQATRAARIALQLIPSGFRHQRSYEILACGTLPLTRYCARDFGCLPLAEYARLRDAGENPPGDNLFSGLERIAFETRAQFETLAERYLANDAACAEVVADLRRTVLEHCTYDAAMRQVMTTFQQQLRSAAASTGDGANRPRVLEKQA